MDEDDIHRKVGRLRAHMEALAAADLECLAELRRLHAILTAVHSNLPEARLLKAPAIGERFGTPKTNIPLDHDGYLHDYHAPQIRSEGLRCRITFNPRRGTHAIWIDDKRKDLEADAVVDLYTDRLAAWTIQDYPRAESQERSRQASAEIERQRRLKAEREAVELARREAAEQEIHDARARTIGREFEYGCLVLIVIVVAFFVIHTIAVYLNRN